MEINSIMQKETDVIYLWSFMVEDIAILIIVVCNEKDLSKLIYFSEICYNCFLNFDLIKFLEKKNYLTILFNSSMKLHTRHDIHV